VTRDGVIESLHLGHLVALNADGSTFISAGSPELPIFPRSAIKAIQAAAMLRAGLKVDDQKLALICASHSGSEIHINLTKKILADAGISESAMQNAIDKPLGEKERFA
jgi:L-asparaginase II